MIISIGRQAGSGGQEMAKFLSSSLGFKFWDKKELLKYADDLGYFDQMNRFYNEMPVNTLLAAIAKNEGADEDKQIIKKIYHSLLAEDNFVILGRCANYFLRNNQNFMSIFLHANQEFKLKRLLDQGYDLDSAISYMKKEDSDRYSFHKYYTNEEWGGSSFYDICINTSKFGVPLSSKFVLDLAREYLQI